MNHSAGAATPIGRNEERAKARELEGKFLRVITLEDKSTIHNAFRQVLQAMKVNYYPETDSLYIDLSEQQSVESREISEGVVLDYDGAGKLVGIDIDNASTKVELGVVGGWSVGGRHVDDAAPSSRGRWRSSRREAPGGRPRRRTVDHGGSWAQRSNRCVKSTLFQGQWCESSSTEVSRAEFLTRTALGRSWASAAPERLVRGRIAAMRACGQPGRRGRRIACQMIARGSRGRWAGG